MNFKLLRAIKEEKLTQRDFAKLVGDHESMVSRIINGVWNVDAMRRIRYSKVLGRKPEDLFPEEHRR